MVYCSVDLPDSHTLDAKGSADYGIYFLFYGSIFLIMGCICPMLLSQGMQDQIEVMKTKVVVSVGDAAQAVDAAIQNMPAELKPAWHLGVR